MPFVESRNGSRPDPTMLLVSSQRRVRKTIRIEPVSLIGYYLILFRDPKRDFITRGFHGLHHQRITEALSETRIGPAIRAGFAEYSGHFGLRHALHALFLHRRARRPAAQETADEGAGD